MSPLLSFGRRVLSVLALVSGASLFGASDALVADFRLASDYSNNGAFGIQAWVAPYGTSATLDFTGSAWEWSGATGSGQGLQLNIPAQLSTYTLALSFSFSDVTGYRKIIDFKHLSAESGIYAYSKSISVYSGSHHGGGSLTENTYTHLLITREATGESSGNLSVYLNGERISFGDDDFFVDSDGAFTISQLLYFGLDDRNGTEFASNGGFANLQLWNYVLSDSEIEDVVSDIIAIPEPSTTAVLAGLAGLGAVLIYRRRR